MLVLLGKYHRWLRATNMLKHEDRNMGFPRSTADTT
ncbi:hypothetical protein GGQ18_000022 [Salinibacter ruber]|nr:hypothetical protein [Salinibacter ruber]